MKSKLTLLITGFIALTVLGVMFFLCINQPYQLSGFKISSSTFTVAELFRGGPADCSGIKLGDTILRINNIEASDIIQHFSSGLNSDWYKTYSVLFSKGELYHCELLDGTVHIFRIPDDIPFADKIRFLSIDDKIGFGVGALFILIGILLCVLSYEAEGISAFTGFLYFTGICLANAYSDTHNTFFYSVCNLVLFQISTTGMAVCILLIVAYFYRLAGCEKKCSLVMKIRFIPYALIIIRLIDTCIHPLSFLDGLFFYLPYFNYVFMIYAVIVFIILMKHIPPQSSLILRFFLLGICFSLAPALTILVVKVVSSELAQAVSGESFKTFLPLIFLPACLFCSFIQTKRTKLDAVFSKIIITGCAILTVLILTYLPVNIPVYRGFLIALAPFMFLLLEKPVTNFLYPQIEYVTESFSDLEKLVFSCDNEKDMYALVADWLFTVLNPGFIAFYEFPDEEKGVAGKTLFKKSAEGYVDEASLVSFIAERCSDEEGKEKLVIHDTWGISAPIYKAHHVFGYVFIGTRSRYDMFSNMEMRLLQPTTRILMEALLVFDLKQQVEYINNMQNRIVYSFADMIESRDGTTGQHVKRTSLVVEMLTRYLKKNAVYDKELDASDYGLISLAAPLHDIGKIKVPDRILSKPGKLTEEEFEIIKTHPVVGEKIINKTMFKIEDEHYLKMAREMALYHHEKWDGTGYPEGLKEYAIPVSARIMAVADVFDALCSTRSYKKAFTIDEAFDILDKSSGTHFEPVLVEAMHDLKDELSGIYVNAD